ncbi:MAG: hypothetical protein V3T98_01605 [Candidatus Paceibacterota bacterium]
MVTNDSDDVIGEICDECGEKLSRDGTCLICSPNKDEGIDDNFENPVR